jgi:ABC-type glycerol-3-phosphate transport system permease component
MSGLQLTVLTLLVIGIALGVGSMANRRLKKPAGLYGRWVALAGAACLTMTPFVWLIAASFKDKAFLNKYVFLPPPSEWEIGLTLDNFKTLFLEPRESISGAIYFVTFIGNSLFLACTTTVLSVIFCSLAGYTLAKYEFKGRNALMVFMLATMMVPGMLFLAPSYRLMNLLGWLDTYYALIVPVICSTFGIFLFRQAIVAIPSDLIEAARIDGASEFRIWWQVIMPLVKPMTGAYCLIIFLQSWNNYLGPQIMLSSEEKSPLSVILLQYAGQYQDQYGLFLAGTLLAIIPPAILFFALQKEFIAGLTSGAVKG